MMKLSDTFTSRIVIDKSKTDANCVAACMLFLKALELDLESEKKITELTEVSRNSIAVRRRKLIERG